MTKEEILDNALPDVIEYPHYNLDNFQRRVALDAMDEYAKSQVIAYELWINEMLMDDSSFSYEKTPEQLYNLFLEHQLNNGGKYKC